MKKIRLLAVALMLFTGTAIIQQKATAQVSVNFQVFYDDLSPYGDWVDYNPYGYVWVPRVSRGFIPYRSNGYWVYTYDGWTWVSNYRWGWAPFHYGRWLYDGYYGWVWVPDNEWGPAWVSWRSSNDYYGWAPLGPGISIDLGLPLGIGYDMPYDHWTFVRNNDFGRPNIYNYYIDNSTNVNIFNNTTVINNIQVNNTYNTRYNAGPVREDAERRSGRRFTPVAIKESSKPAQNISGNELQLYRPRVQNNNAGGQRPAPKTIKARDVKAQPQRQVDVQREERGVEQQKVQQQQREQQRVEQQQKVQQQKEQQRVQQQQQQRDQQRVEQQQRVQQQKEQQRVQQQQQQREQQRVEQQQKVQQQKEQQRVQQQQQQREQQRVEQQQKVQQQQQQRVQQQQQREQQRVQPPQQQQRPQQERPNNRPPGKGKGNG